MGQAGKFPYLFRTPVLTIHNKGGASQCFPPLIPLQIQSKLRIFESIAKVDKIHPASKKVRLNVSLPRKPKCKCAMCLSPVFAVNTMCPPLITV